MRVTGNKARQMVEAKLKFEVNQGTLRGEWYEFVDGNVEPIYVVWTYRKPLYVYDKESDQWFGNNEKYSRTSSKHKGQAQPWNVKIHWRDESVMTELAQNGLVGAVRKRFKEAV